MNEITKDREVLPGITRLSFGTKHGSYSTGQCPLPLSDQSVWVVSTPTE